MLSVVKFSPDGSKLAVAYAPPNSSIYVYDLSESDPKPKLLGDSPSRVNSIDFTTSGLSIMANNTSYQIDFYDVNPSKKRPPASSFKREEWASLTARFSWGTQGIWPPCSDGTDINSVDRSNSKKYIATADDFSKVKIFDYPVCQEKQIYNAYKGHSAHVTGVKWSFDDKYLISTGGL
jgi:WD40 repeat protein